MVMLEREYKLRAATFTDTEYINLIFVLQIDIFVEQWLTVMNYVSRSSYLRIFGVEVFLVVVVLRLS